MILFMQFFVSGVSIGSIYALLALGFVLIYKVFNLCLDRPITYRPADRFAVGHMHRYGIRFCP